MGQVSGLLNLFRQLGGSMGIALVATLLDLLSHQNYLDMAAKVSLLNPNIQAFYMQSQGAMAHKLTKEVGFNFGSQNTLKTLFYKVQSQVFMMSFLQLVCIMMIMVSFVFIPLGLIKFKRKPVLVADAH